jgi:hypothetical protein
MMKGTIISIALLCLLVASAAMGAPWYFNFQVSGTLLSQPAQYSGIFTSGATGTLRFTLDDTGWPVEANARFAHIWSTYFAPHYYGTPAGAEKWVGTMVGRFYMTVTAGPVGYKGTCEGTITADFTVRDMDADGVLDESEKDNWNNMLDGRLAKFCTDPSTGEMVCKKGNGALNSNGFAFKYPPDVNVLNGNGNLWLIACPSADEPTSWGLIKSLYR